MPFSRLFAGAFTLATILALPAVAGRSPDQTSPVVRTGHARAELVAGVESIAPGDSFHVALRLQPDSGWHVYWLNPGDAGMPPALEWDLPAEWTAGPLRFPIPERFETPPLASFGYKDDVWYPARVMAGVVGGAGHKASLRARAEWLICREECLPEAADFTLALGVGETVPHATNAARVREALARLPRPAPDWNAHAAYEDSVVVISWDVPEGFRDDFRGGDVFFFPAAQGVLRHAAAQTLIHDGARARLTIPRDDVLRDRPDTLRGVLVAGVGDERRGYELLIAAADAGEDGKPGLLPALLVGLLSLAVLILIFVLKRPHVSGAR